MTPPTSRDNCQGWSFDNSHSFVILSDRKGGEGSSHQNDCLANCACEGSSTPLRFAQNDKIRDFRTDRHGTSLKCVGGVKTPPYRGIK